MARYVDVVTANNSVGRFQLAESSAIGARAGRGNSNRAADVAEVAQSQAAEAPAPLTINPFAGGDFVVNAAEANAGIVVSGTAEPGALIDLRWHGDTVIVRNDYADENGNWSVNFDVTPGEGTTYLYVADFIEGNEDVPGMSVHVDTVAPDVPTINAVEGDNEISAQEAADGVAVSGSGEAGASVAVTWGGVTETTQINPNGNWSVNFASVPVTGSSTITAVVTDSVGNVSDSASIDVSTGVAPLTVNPVAGDNHIDASEQGNGYVVSGTGEPGSLIDIRWHGTEDALVGYTWVDDNGNWSYTFDTTPGPGNSYLYVADFVDGNEEVPGIEIYIGSVEQAPLVVDTVAGDNVVNAAEAASGVVVSGTAQPGALIDLRWHGSETVLAGGVYADSDGNWSYTFDGTPGEGQSYLYAEDFISGNEDLPVILIQVDTVAPESPTIYTVEGDNVITSNEASDGVAVNGSAEAGSSVEVTWGDATRTTTAGSNGNWSVNFATVPVEGEAEISAVATDSAGNPSNSASLTVTTEASVAPLTMNQVTGDNVVTSAEVEAGILVSGTGEPGALIDLRWHGTGETQVGAAWVDDNGNWSYTFENTPGPGSSIMYAADFLDGNEELPGMAIEVVTSAPLTVDTVESDNAIDAIEAADGVEVSGTAEPNTTIDIQWYGDEVLTAYPTSDENGNWSHTFDGTPGEGNTYLYVADYLPDNEDVPVIVINVDTVLSEEDIDVSAASNNSAESTNQASTVADDSYEYSASATQSTTLDNTLDATI